MRFKSQLDYVDHLNKIVNIKTGDDIRSVEFDFFNAMEPYK